MIGELPPVHGAPEKESAATRLYQSATSIYNGAVQAYTGAVLTGNAELIQEHRDRTMEALSVFLDAQEAFLREHWRIPYDKGIGG